MLNKMEQRALYAEALLKAREQQKQEEADYNERDYPVETWPG